jgi:hypothetical protein
MLRLCCKRKRERQRRGSPEEGKLEARTNLLAWGPEVYPMEQREKMAITLLPGSRTGSLGLLNLGHQPPFALDHKTYKAPPLSAASTAISTQTVCTSSRE